MFGIGVIFERSLIPIEEKFVSLNSSNPLNSFLQTNQKTEPGFKILESAPNAFVIDPKFVDLYCAYCLKEGKTMRCSKCKYVKYCS